MAVAALVLVVDVHLPTRPEGGADELLALSSRGDLNVVLLVVDTLRADRLGAYGYARDTSPALDALAATGVRFARVRAQSTWTKSSMASLMTGTWPRRHGLLRFPHALTDDKVLPAELLRDAGFTTAGIYRNGWVAPEFGFGQGYDVYYKPLSAPDPLEVQRRNPGAEGIAGTDLDLTRAAQEFLRAHRNDRFYLYLHYMDVHQFLYEEGSALFGTRLTDAYDNAIHWTDRNVAELLGTLDELGLRDRTIVALVSDHGEAFREHGTEGHARDLYAPTSQTPFLLSLPFRFAEPVVVEEWVGNVDVWPTLLDLLGLPPLPGAQGRSLVPLVAAAARGEPTAPLAPETLHAELDTTWGRGHQDPDPLVSVTEGGYRAILRPLRAPDRVELYDLREDPGEQHDLADEEPEVAARLRARLEAYLRDAGPGDEVVEVDLQEGLLKRLIELGYVVDPAGENEPKLPGGGRPELPPVR